MKNIKLKLLLLGIIVAVFVGALGYFTYQKSEKTKSGNLKTAITKTSTPEIKKKKESTSPQSASDSFEKKTASDLNVLSIKPSSTTRDTEIRQITITFNKSMVPVGDFRKLAVNLPIDIQPKIDCQWRWLNPGTVACSLKRSLPPSNRYQIQISAGIKTYDGIEMNTSYTTSFNTLQWEVKRENKEWKDADLPILYWTFNQPMNPNSIQEKLSSTCGPVTVGKITKKTGKKFRVDRSRTYSIRFVKKIGLSKNCLLELPAETKALLGDQPGKPYSSKFSTYPEFKIAEVYCKSDNKTQKPEKGIFILTDCETGSDVIIKLSAPVFAKELAGKIQVEPFFGWTKGGMNSPEYLRQNPYRLYTQIRLNGPMGAKQNYLIEIGSIRDRFDRPLKGPKIIEISTADFPPEFIFSEGFGVLEKNGPYQVGYEAMNLSQFNLKYYFSSSPEDLTLWKYYEDQYDYCQKKNFPKLFDLKSVSFATNAKPNQPFVAPLDLKKIVPDFQYGMFMGNVQSPKILSGTQTKNSYFKKYCRNFFLVVTDLGISAKVGFYDSGVWIHSISTGKPLSGVKVKLVGYQAILLGYQGILSEGETDEDGFVRLSGASEWDPERKKFDHWKSKDKLFVIAQTEDDFSVLPFEQGTGGISPYNFSERGNYMYGSKLSASENHIVHAITDRPLYRPGREVNIKFFARQWEPQTFGMIPEKQIAVEIYNSQGKKIKEKTLNLSDYGTTGMKLKIDAGAPLGNYSIYSTVGDWRRRVGSFDVQEFTLPPFKVEVEAPRKKFRMGNTATFQTSVKYHFGGGVSDTEGNYSLSFQEKSWKPTLPKWKSFRFDDPVSVNLPGYEKPRSFTNRVLEDGKLKTDKNGEITRNIHLSGNQIRSYGALRFEAYFKDDRGKSIAGNATAEVFYADFQLGLKKDQWVYEPGEPIETKVILVNSEEEPVQGRKISLKLVHRSYQTVRTRGQGNYFNYETRTTDKVVDKCEVVSEEDVVSCPLTAKVAGSHFILAEAVDSKRRLAVSSLHVYITGSEYIGWYRENHDRIDIIPDKNSYQVGDEISLLIKNPYEEADAVISLERFGILHQFRHSLTGGAEIVKIPVDSEKYAPGFYISVQIIKGRVSEKIEDGVDLGKPSFKMGMTKIKVTNPDTFLQIETSAEEAEYQPGDTVRAQVHVVSNSGYKQAELAVFVVDEKILQLAGAYRKKFNMHDQFYQLRGVDVRTSQMLSFLIGRRHFGQKGEILGSDGLGKALLALDVRENFLPLAYQNLALETDNFGNAEFSFKAPDNLTSWKILVVAVDKEHRFGFGENSFKTNKKVIIEPALPSFLTEGDQLKSRFSVLNRSKSPGIIKGSIDVQGVELTSSKTKQIEIPDKGKEFLEWPILAPFGSKNASFTVRAILEETEFGDAARFRLPIRPFTTYDIFADYGSLTKKEIKIPIQIPQGIRPELGGLEITYGTSLLSGLDDTLRYGLNYPYACWEQKMSRILFWNSYTELKNYLSLPEVKKDPKEEIRKFLNLMPNYQASNGGMSYWKKSLKTVDPYLSVYTALGMIWLDRAKVPIPEKPTQKVLAYTKNLLAGKELFPNWYSTRAKNTVLAMAAYVRRLKGDSAEASVNRIYDDRNQMSLFGKSFLWSATSLKPGDQKLSESLQNEIFNTANLTSGKIEFQQAEDNGYSRILYSNTRTNCRLLSAMLEKDPSGKFIEPLVRHIIDARKSNRWRNTQENLFCLYALKEYARIYEKDSPDFKASLQVATTQSPEVSFRGFKQEPVTQKVKFSEIENSIDPEVTVTKEGEGRLYYTTRMRVAYKKVQKDPMDAGMQVSRKYYTQGKNKKWILQTGDVKIQRGDVIRIELTVSSPTTGYQIALADSLPAGLEPLNTALATTAKTTIEQGSDKNTFWDENDWWNHYFRGGFYHREMRLFGAQYFADFLTPGDYTVSYLAQAIAVGEFNTIPAVAERMYEPEIYGKSAPAKFIISE